MGSNRFEPIQIKEETEPVFPVGMFLTTSCYVEKKSGTKKFSQKRRVSLPQVFEKLPVEVDGTLQSTPSRNVGISVALSKHLMLLMGDRISENPFAWSGSLTVSLHTARFGSCSVAPGPPSASVPNTL